MVIFEGKNLSILNKAGKLILNNFSFAINAGEIWMAVGPNGIGKSSLWETLIGIGRLEKGQLLLADKEITHLIPSERVRLGMSYIAQNCALFDDISVENNLKMVAESLLPASEHKQAVEKAIRVFWLESLAKKRPNQLSGGQRRRVELAKIIIGKAKLVLMDEPFAAVDEEYTEKTTAIFVNMKKNGVSFLVNDHNNAAVRKISDYCIHLGQTGHKNAVSIEKISK